MTDKDNMNELGAVGSILIDPRALEPLRKEVVPEDFANGICRRIFETACNLQDSNSPVDVMTISTKLNDIPNSFFTELMDITPTAANVSTYGQNVHIAARVRKIHELAGSMTQKSEIGELADLYKQIDVQLSQLKIGNHIMSSPMQMQNFLFRLKQISCHEDDAVVPTGFKTLDSLLGGGLVKEGLYILAARPGVGKTTMAMSIGENIAQNGGVVLFCSLEMSNHQIVSRRVSKNTGIAIRCYQVSGLGLDKDNEVFRYAWNNTIKGVSELSKHEFWLYSNPQPRVADIELAARSIPNLSCVIIDYLGLIKHTGKGSLYEKVTNTSNSLKRMARSLGVPVLCLAQLNRDSVKSGHTRPTMADLRDSGAIEQDADGIMLISPEGESDNTPIGKRILRLQLAKNRHGGTGSSYFEMYGINGQICPLDDYNPL